MDKPRPEEAYRSPRQVAADIDHARDFLLALVHGSERAIEYFDGLPETDKQAAVAMLVRDEALEATTDGWQVTEQGRHILKRILEVQFERYGIFIQQVIGDVAPDHDTGWVMFGTDDEEPSPEEAGGPETEWTPGTIGDDWGEGYFD